MWCQNSGWLHAWEFEVGWDFAICLRSTGINLRRAKSVYNRMHIYSHTLERPTKRENKKSWMGSFCSRSSKFFHTLSRFIFYVYSWVLSFISRAFGFRSAAVLLFYWARGAIKKFTSSWDEKANENYKRWRSESIWKRGRPHAARLNYIIAAHGVLWYDWSGVSQMKFASNLSFTSPTPGQMT